MSRIPLSQFPRHKLSETDKSQLAAVAALYERATETYSTANSLDESKPNKRWALYDRAQGMRAKAVQDLMAWANRHLGEFAPGHPHGSNHPRLQKAYDHRYDHRKLGGAGCAKSAATFLRKVIKRGWI